MTSKVFRAKIKFNIDSINRGDQLSAKEAGELINFIIDALETWGGQRHPDDWLFGSLENVNVELSGSGVAKMSRNRDPIAT